VVTEDRALAEKIRMLGNYGSRERYLHETRGANSRMDPIQAAVLRVKLRRLDAWNDRRRQIAARYVEVLEGIPDLVLPRVARSADPDSDAVWHVFPVLHPERDWLARQLEHAGVGTLIHYPLPPHLSGAYRDQGFRGGGFRRGDFPVAEQIARTELSLPLHPHLTAEQVEEVAGSVCLAACLPAGAPA
jgi:dTDP-3-amino-3,4,6-trideoxy-alpha-D-glucose transaminase